MRYNDLTGERFGRLTVISKSDDYVCPGGYRCVMWKCLCDCGNEVVVRGKSLSGGVTKSCGCLRNEMIHETNKKHGGCGTRLYAIWDSMRQRCNNKNNHAYENYGGRGISICGAWDDFSAFESWAYESGYNDSAKRGECTLDRIDVDGNYCPANCRWTDMSGQSSNRRNTPYVELNGDRHTLTEWAEITGIKYQTLWKRYRKGKSAEEILNY